MEVVDPMNPSEMLDYTLGQLDGPARDEAEAEIARDPQLAATLDRLGQSIHRLLDDGEEIEVPAGLARRTITFVAEHSRRRSILDFVPRTVPFRWADVAVAASIFFASLLTLVPAVQRSKDRMDQAGCGFNLQQLGIGLAQYAALHGLYPHAPADQPGAASGTFAVTLQDSGMLRDVSTLDCPCNGRHPLSRPMPHLKDLQGAAPDSLRETLPWDYAYHTGYRRAPGAAAPVPAMLTSRIPLLADQPAHERGRILDGNSPNHGLRGQNVLYSDIHVQWHNDRRVGPFDLDMYLNEDHHPAPGLNVHDAVLVPSLCPFGGW
jgi:hypothetical protein